MGHDMTIGPLIGQGTTADIFGWADGQVLKLFHEDAPVNEAEKEARINRVVYEAGLPVPAVFDVVVVNGRQGIIYERVTGPSLLDETRTKPWQTLQIARRLADLHVQTHACVMANLSSKKEQLEGHIVKTLLLSSGKKEILLTQLKQLPNDNILCHGDFHPDNILVSARGPIIIDWVNAAQGQPAADVARTLLLLRHSIFPPNTPTLARWFFIIMRRAFADAYLKQYLQQCPTILPQIVVWQPLVAAASLYEGIVDEGKLHQIIETGIGKITLEP